MISEDQRVRVIRAILGWESRAFAEKIGVTPNCVTNWEKGRSVPQEKHRNSLAKICEENRIVFDESGIPYQIDRLDATM